MTQLSRKERYQSLRDQIDEETTLAQSQPVKLSRLSRTESLSHANKPLYPHDTVKVQPTVKEMPTSPVIEDLLGEVKKYNIDNGNRITDDTQINILKTLDTGEVKRRNSHFVEMDDDTLGSTMRMPNEKTVFNDDVNAIPNQRLTRINPVTTKKTSDEPKKDRIVLSSNDIVSDENPTFDNLELMDMNHDSFDKTEEQPKKAKKAKRNKKAEKKATKKSRVEEYDEPKRSSSETLINVILILLIIALLAATAYLFLTWKSII